MAEGKLMGRRTVQLLYLRFIYAPLSWQTQGRQQTASGFGRRLTTHYKVFIYGRYYRVYATCVFNAVSHWITLKGQRVYVDAVLA
jgi:hypothetical protein